MVPLPLPSSFLSVSVLLFRISVSALHFLISISAAVVSVSVSAAVVSRLFFGEFLGGY
jgi:hypothetical protein